MLEKRFWAKVEKTPSCWPWTAGTRNGYGRYYRFGKMETAHILLYKSMRGPIKKGLQLDHLCRNRSCVNPDHLEQVTSRENTLRGESYQAINARKKECCRGHKFTKENTHIDKLGQRRCRKCDYLRTKKRRQLRIRFN